MRADEGHERKMAPRFDRLMRASSQDIAVTKPIVALLRAAVRVGAVLEDAVSPAGLTVPQYSVLMELAATPGGRLPLCEIGRRCLKSPPNVTAIVDRLESVGLVRRVRDDADRRVVLAEITDPGWDSLGVAAPRVSEAERSALAALSDTDRAALTDPLDRVARELPARRSPSRPPAARPGGSSAR